MRNLVMTSIAGALVLGGFAACSNNSGGPDVQDGGLGFTVNEAVFLNAPPTTFVYLSERTGLCALLNSGLTLENLQSTSTLVLDLINIVDVAGHTLPVDAGTYQVVLSTTVAQPGLYALVGVVTTDAMCGGGEFDGTRGSVELSSINANDGGYATGTYDIIFGSLRVPGSFDAGFCNFTYVSDGGGPLLPDGGAPCL
jgi:hypothetical protein